MAARIRPESGRQANPGFLPLPKPTCTQGFLCPPVTSPELLPLVTQGCYICTPSHPHSTPLAPNLLYPRIVVCPLLSGTCRMFSEGRGW